MLYRAYSNPTDLMSRYINQGRFGTFVEGFLQAEYDKRKAESERDQEMMLWIAYVHSYSKDTFSDWRKKVCKADSTTTGGSDEDMTEQDMEKIISKLFPGKNAGR
jgi:hypothetical protein